MKVIGPVAAWILILTGCTVDQGNEEPDSATDEIAAVDRIVACELVPGSDVEDIMGLPIQEARAEEYEDSFNSGSQPRYMSSCTYIAEAGQAVRTATIQVARAPEVTDPGAELQRYEDGLQEFGDVDIAPVPDLGPGAGWHAAVEQLSVYRPGWRIMASVDQRGAIPGLEGAKLLASRMLERLPESP